jgi:hypothetical protein
MGNTRLALTLAVILSLPSATHASKLPPGYFLDEAQMTATRPVYRVEADGDFTLSITRKYDDATAAHLLNLAESLYPPRDAIIDRAIERASEIGPDSAGTALWWQDGLGVSRVPYAVTAGALNFYADLTDRFRAHNFRGAWDHNLFWTDLRYEASIERRAVYYLADTTLTNVYLAEISLSWTYDDGTFVPATLAHRLVVMTKDGAVLDIAGDGYTDEQVNMSGNRGIGRTHNVFR